LAQRILCRDARRAVIGVTGLSLNTTDCKHEAARHVTPVSAERENAGHIKAGDDPPGRAESDGAAQARTHQTIVDEDQAFPQRRPDMVDELQRRSAGAALRTVDHNEVGAYAGLEHSLADAHELPGVPDTQLEADRLAPR